MEILFRLQRVTKKTNENRVGGGMVRYAKNRPLNPETGAWQLRCCMGTFGS